MSIGIKTKKGLDLQIQGAIANPDNVVVKPVTTVAIVPDDFVGIVPKMEVREGDTVLMGQPLYHSKANEALKVVSPAQGIVKAVVRGERRKILRIEVEVTGIQVVKHDTTKALTDASAAKALLLESGLWAMTLQRPYAVVTNPDAEIRDIFIAGFDSAPLAESYKDFNPEQASAMQAGVDLLNLLTEGKVYITRRDWQRFPELKGAEIITVEGPHPSGNVGTAIGKIGPVNKGETVMTLTVDTLLRIGTLVQTGNVPYETRVAICGSEVEAPKMIYTLVGASLRQLLDGELKQDGKHHRIISGNVLTGVKSEEDGYLRYPYTQISVIPEGDNADEFMGWASFSPDKMSTSRSFPGHFLGKKLFNPDARLLGGRRAMIMSGQYDKMMPLDILPEYLIKAILSRDIDRMEQLGIYEVAPEDFALAEYADTSKLELQKIVREGLDYLRSELE